MSTTQSVLAEIECEVNRQNELWNEQNYAWNTDELAGSVPSDWLLTREWTSQDDVKAAVEGFFANDQGGFAEILFEEVAEALDEPDISNVRTELIQVAAVALQAVKSIDRNGR
jgi:hypothetical protein